MSTSGPRLTAEARREAVLDAAVVEFAAGGLDGTSTEAIARRAGISQPYVFRLFPSKKELFIAVVRRTFDVVRTRFEEAAGDLTGRDALGAMGVSYEKLIADRDFLLIQLHAYAACGDEDVRAATRRGFRDLWYAVERISGVPVDEVKQFFAYGMLWNVVTAMDLSSVQERWATNLCPEAKA